MTSAARALVVSTLWAGWLGGSLTSASAQDDAPVEIVRPAPPALDDLETDKNQDGVPDGWYNARDAKVMTEGGVIGPRFLRFECAKMGRPARLSRAFGVDGRKHEAIVIGLWVRVDQIQAGERMGEEPGLLIDFLGDQLRQVSRGTLGPWTARNFGGGPHWTRVAKRIPVPPGTHDAIMSVGLLGATGVLDVDGLTFELVPRGGGETSNLAKNPGFELGDPDPAGWVADNGARRGFPGFRSTAALELARSGARCMTGLALPVEPFPSLAISVKVRGQGLRGGGGAAASLFFLEEDGRILPGLEEGVRAFLWGDTFDWREDRTVIEVPRGAVRAVLQFEKSDGLGSIKLDDLSVTASPDPGLGVWTPYHVEEDTNRWLPVAPSKGIEAGSALDFSFLLEGPAGKRGAVTVKEGRLTFARGGRARFFGVQLMPPTAFLDADRADALADRLARSGVNLVRLGDLDTPLGPDRSLIDDTRDDTKAFDPVALARLDHLAAALKKRGVYVALELQGARRFRPDDGVAMPGALPPGGGPAAVFDPVMTRLETDTARALLAHVNKETGVAWKDEPALAWVTLAGEVSAFDLADTPNALPGDYLKAYRELASRSTSGTGRRFWQGLDSSHYKELADALRKDKLKAPLASVSHWRRDRPREHEFAEALAAPGFDLIDDRIYWPGPLWIAPRWRSMLWSLDGGLIVDAARKRRPGRPYVLGQWCDYTQGVWASPFEAAEQVLAAATALSEDWDGLVRRGLFLYPDAWGGSAPGTGGGEDIFQIPEVANAAPHVFALWPHAASILTRGHAATAPKDAARDREKPRPKAKPDRAGGRARRPLVPGWEPDRGRLVIDTPYTQGVAGWPGDQEVEFEHLLVEVENTYATVVASSAGPEPIAAARRLLVTAVARVTPTGFRWADEWRRETADPGRPPLLAEPVVAKVTWYRKGTIKAYALDNQGARVSPVPVRKGIEGGSLVLDGTTPSLHFEMVVDE